MILNDIKSCYSAPSACHCPYDAPDSEWKINVGLDQRYELLTYLRMCTHMIHYISLESQSQHACYGLDKTNIFIRRYILYFIRYFVNFRRKLQTTTTCRAEQSSADVETGRPLQDSLRPATLLPSEGYYTLFFGFNLSQTAFFAQTALNFSRFDVIILKLVSVSE